MFTQGIRRVKEHDRRCKQNGTKPGTTERRIATDTKEKRSVGGEREGQPKLPRGAENRGDWVERETK